MTDISSAESAYLRGKSRYERWRVAFELRWNKPHVDTLIGMTADKLSKLPPDVQQMSRQNNPDDWKLVDNYRQEVKKNAKRLEK